MVLQTKENHQPGIRARNIEILQLVSYKHLLETAAPTEGYTMSPRICSSILWRDVTVEPTIWPAQL